MSSIDILNLVVTLILIALLVFGVIKKANPAMLLLGLGIAGLLYATIINGSLMGDASVGSSFFDVFQFTENEFVSQFASNLIILCTVMAYVSYMNALKATDMMCLLLAKPLSVFKRFPMVMVGGIIVIIVLMKWVIFSAVGQVALVMATLFPIAISIGVSVPTMAAAMTFASVIAWGPANGLTLMYWGAGNPAMSVAQYFMHDELIFVPIALILAIVAFGISSKFFDKKEKIEEASEDLLKTTDINSLDIPKWYAIFPMLPVILVIIFSDLVVKTVTISVTSACLLCMILVFVLELIRKRDRVATINQTAEFWKGFGNIIWQSGNLVLTCAVFAAAITNIGGMSKFFTIIVGNGSGNATLLLLVCAVFSGFLTLVSGNPASAIALFAPIMADISSAAGMPFEHAVALVMPLCCLALCVSPINPAGLMIAGQCNVSIGTIIKRCLIPFIVYVLAALVVVLLFL